MVHSLIEVYKAFIFPSRGKVKYTISNNRKTILNTTTTTKNQLPGGGLEAGKGGGGSEGGRGLSSGLE